MAIVIGSIKQESNSFCPVPTPLSYFRQFYGDEMFEHLRGSRTEVGGFLSVLDKTSFELKPLLSANSISGGPVTAEAYRYLQGELLRRLKEVPEIEAVCLALHGAMMSEDCDDTEGETLRLVREAVGPNVPIAVSLDPHCHLSPEMLEAADILVAYRTFPHVDQYETGLRAGRLLVDMLEERLKPVMEVERIPMLISPEAQMDTRSPMRDLLDLSVSLESRPGIRSVSYCPVQPWMDMPGTAQVALVIADNDRAAAKETARILADQAWEKRFEFVPERLSAQDAVRRAVDAGQGCYVLTESADAPPAGAPGDSVLLLKTLLEEKVSVPAMVTVVDAAGVEAAYAAGVGNRVEAKVGHSLDPRWGEPITIEGEVVKLTDGSYLSQFSNTYESMGKTALIQSGSISIVLCAKPFSHMDPNSYRSLGLEPSEARIVGVKSTVHFRAFYAPIAAEIIYIEAMGASSGRFENFEWKRLSRPMWPLDEVIRE